jgi:MFS family permease
MSDRPVGVVPPVGRITWLVLALNLVSCVGSGLTKPFLIVYLHEVRGMGLGTSGLLLASVGFAGLVTMPMAGVLIDRVGPFKAFAAGQVLGGVGTVWFVLATSPLMALVACLLLGASGGITTNGLSTLLAVVVPSGQRGSAFGLGYTTYNIGTGLGAMTAGFVVSFGAATAYTTVFLVDGVSFVLFAVVLLMLERRAPAQARGKRRENVGYRAVLADRGLLAAFVLSSLFWTVALSQTTAAFPAWATGPAEVSTAVVGVALAVNTVVLAVSQLIVLRVSRGRRRTSAAAVAGVVFAVAWLVTTPTSGGGVAAGWVLILAMAVFAIGEAVLAPALPAMINDLADDELRGRYNAVFNMSTQIGQIAGPAMAGWLLSGGNGVLLLGLLVAGCLLASVSSLAARRIIPGYADRGHGS